MSSTVGKKTSTAGKKRKSPVKVEPVREENRVAPSFNMPKFSMPKQPSAKIVVAIDFGTTYSGFAYALSSHTDKVYVFYDWPGQQVGESKPYCKTPTSLLYLPTEDSSNYKLDDWGWMAIWNYNQALQNLAKNPAWNVHHAAALESCGYLARKFKLDLAPTSCLGGQTFLVSPPPHGLTAKRLISDYLEVLCEFIMSLLHRSYGEYISKKDVQWCLTVPAIWDDGAKQKMVECAETAGLVSGSLCKDALASPHPLIVVLEPEAASVYCQMKLKEINFTKGSKFLVVDVGGGTVDLVVHEKVEEFGLKIKEIACSTGDLCGGTYVDEAFYRFISEKISCFQEFSAIYPATVLRMYGYIEKVKSSFNGESGSFVDYIEIPARLAKAWESYDTETGWWRGDGMYDILTISTDELISIFSGVVEMILQLIGDQLDANPKLEAIMVVGGFSSSPYLMRRIGEKFSSRVDKILNPIDPGTAVCQGAVAFGAINAEVMLSRKSRKTYGIAQYRTYRVTDPLDKKYVSRDGRIWCKDVFCLYVTKGDDIPVNHSVKRDFVPIERTSTCIRFRIYATSETNPIYITDDGMELIGSWNCPLPLEARHRSRWPAVQVDMFFGRTTIEVSSNPLNFQGPSTMTSVELEKVFV